MTPLDATEPTPLLAVWELTLACDLACAHCGSRAGKPRAAELTPSEALSVVRQLAELGVREVSLLGGEVYLRPDWLAIIGAIRGAGMLPTMVTGGRGFTVARAREARGAGLGSMSVSVDGEAEAHDTLRNLRGAHASAMSALDAAAAAGLPAAVNTQLNRLSWRDLDPTLERIAARGARSWQVQLTAPMGRAADRPDLVLQPWELLDLFPALAAAATRARGLGVDFVCANNVGYFGPHDEVLRLGTADGHWLSCGAGIATIGIEADGAVKGCLTLATEAWAGGTVRTQPLRELWRARPVRHVRERSREELWGFCATCYYADRCRGGCTWMSDTVLGRPGNNPYCHHRALELARRGLRERIEQVAPAPGTAFDRARFVVVEEPLR